MTKLLCPGNLLLLGEYAVLEEGGLGIAIAAQRHVRGEIVRGAMPCISGIFPGGSESVKLGQLGTRPDAGASLEPLALQANDGLLARLLAGFAPMMQGERDSWSLDGSLTIDSSALFGPQGRKLGLGSSAAISALLARALAPRDAAAGDLLQPAIEAHRSAQGGQGSGYDVASSITGGVVLFCGGANPSVEALSVPWLGTVALYRGSSAVVTTGAVSRYRIWREANSTAAAVYLARSNDLVRRFAEEAPESPERAAAIIGEYRKLAAELGDRIGVPARVAQPAELARSPWFGFKAVGAGGELAIALAAGSVARSGHPPRSETSETQSSKIEIVDRDREGVRWE